MPAARQRSRSPRIALAVSAMIGVRGRAALALRGCTRVASKPSICGIWQSMRTAS